MKQYHPPRILRYDLFPENHLLENSVHMSLKDSSAGFNKDNNSADWLSNKKQTGDRPIWNE